MPRFGKYEVPEHVAKMVSSATIVDWLVERGASRLTAERLVAIQRGTAEPGRARTHPQARR